MASDSDSKAVVSHLFISLVTLSPELEVLPQAASEWAVSEGGQKYVFHLRDDLRWTDGRPLTAEDFECAWKRVLDPATASPNAELLYDVQGARAYHLGQAPAPDRVGVRALDRHTLAVRLEAPVAYFLYLLADTATCAVPRHAIEQHDLAWSEPEKIVTSGPFTLEERGGYTASDRGSSGCSPSALVLARNPGYRSQAAGNVARVALRFPTDRQVWLALYEAGEVDVIESTGLLTAGTGKVGLRYADEHLSVPSMATSYLGFGTRRSPFDDRRVRQAFALATYRERVHPAFHGVYTPATGGYVPPGMPGHQAGIALPYDPEGARRLLAEAGYPGGRGFPVTVGLTLHVIRPYLEPLQKRWQEVLGVDIPWESADWTMFHDRMANRPQQLYCIAWGADYPDPDSFLRTSNFRHYTRWRHEVYDRLVEQARRVPDWEERLTLYGRAERILVEEAPILPLSYQRRTLLIKPWVTRYPASAAREHFWEEVILEPHS
jgi:ABC-type oligopeptide transport system substrate-binding subunit